MKKYWRFKRKTKVTTGRRMYKLNKGARGNAVYENNCIYIPENYPEEWRKRLEAGEVISYEEDGEQCEI